MTFSPEEFQALTGAVWIDEMYIPEGAEFPPYSCNEPEKRMSDFLIPLYRAFLKRPPALSIRIAKSNALYAKERIEKGQIVMEYLGAWEPDSKYDSRYRLGPVNAKYYRHFAAFAEDGFPNCAPFYIFQERGLPVRVIFLALDAIEKGEIILYNYGIKHSVKLGEHEEYREEQMVRFFSEHPLKNCFDLLFQPGDNTWEQRFQFENALAKVRYLYHTPSALLFMLLEGHLHPEEVFGYWEQYRSSLLSIPLKPNRREKEAIDCIELIRKYYAGDRDRDEVLRKYLKGANVSVFFHTIFE